MTPPTYSIHTGKYGSLEQLIWITAIPIGVSGPEIITLNVARHASHDRWRLAPWCTEIEVELVVFDVLYASDVSLK